MYVFIVVCVATILAWSSNLNAAEMYKYKDQKGRWVFTDKKPVETDEFESERLLKTELKRKVNIVNRGTKLRPILVAVNKYAGPVELWVDFSKTYNAKFSKPKPHYWLLEPNSETQLLYLEQKNFDRAWSYAWQAQVAVGEPIKKNNLAPVSLGIPFAGGPYIISQAFHGTASHSQHVQSHYAVDVALPEGTPIVAAADGIVMDTEKDFSRSGWEAQYLDEANLVRILHPDKTMTVYAHLAPDKILVTLGQQVQKGTLLGYSGNTGFSGGPHLHFALQANVGKQLVSLPFMFDGFQSHPEQGQWLNAKK